ncbi:hypothetical protein ILYODFUR_034159, partial [Ilyodon furcidens]
MTQNLEEIIRQLSSSSCCLDILPTTFFKKVLLDISSDLIQIINSGVRCFPLGLKKSNYQTTFEKEQSGQDPNTKIQSHFNYIVRSACPGLSPGPPPSGTCLEHFSRKVSRRHPVWMPEPPQQAPLDVEEQQLYSELLTLSLRECP